MATHRYTSVVDIVHALVAIAAGGIVCLLSLMWRDQASWHAFVNGAAWIFIVFFGPRLVVRFCPPAIHLGRSCAVLTAIGILLMLLLVASIGDAAVDSQDIGFWGKMQLVVFSLYVTATRGESLFPRSDSVVRAAIYGSLAFSFVAAVLCLLGGVLQKRTLSDPTEAPDEATD